VLSFDMRPPRLPIRALHALMRLYLRRRLPPPGTPVQPIGISELRSWFPGVSCRTVGIDPEIARLACRTRLTEEIALAIPGLAVHVLAVAEKPQRVAATAASATSER
jgi:hypothetical protein